MRRVETLASGGSAPLVARGGKNAAPAQRALSARIVADRPCPLRRYKGTFPFNSNRCETCKYIMYKDQVVILNTQKVYTILDHYLCASSNVVYMITCTRCSTGGQKLFTRMNHHRRKISTKSCDTPVGQHFCNQNHSLQGMKVLIPRGNFKMERERKIYEFKCIQLFNTLRQGLH
ncbi:hypothetical protein XELAEV_18006995mg [Xenopus laevis]|uniref:Uncharacterized protein n=1 Tax=Xenopus laevis TaxID=8355 RepID=A0A974I4X2_XENLA|nr:hypothetical protein XELAEV_18006995mg [Xenopus laevis]